MAKGVSCLPHFAQNLSESDNWLPQLVQNSNSLSLNCLDQSHSNDT